MVTNQEKFFYGIGASANGIKTDAFTYFLLFFYSNIIGLSPGLSSLAIFIALCVDAVTDPLMGVISDRTNHKNGRRHPYFLLGILPMSLSYFMLFAINSDWGFSQTQLFLWMLIFTIFTRLGITLFDVPHRSLGSEMSQSYSERTSIFSWRELLQTAGGLTNALLAYSVFFRATTEYKVGLLNPEPWIYYGFTGACLMAIAVLTTYFGTLEYKHNRNAIQSYSLGDLIKQILTALKNRNFILFFFGYLFIASSWGISSSLQLYVTTYFWEFETSMLTFFIPIYAFATLSAFLILNLFTSEFEKRNLLMIAIFVAAFINALPFPLAIFGLLPEFGSWKLFFATAPFLFVTSTGLVASAIIRESMLGDISDEVQLNTGFGQQGLMFASSSFIGKLNTGLGILLSGLLLELINFPQGQDAIPDANQIFNLALTQGPFVSLLMIIPFFIFYFYKIDRKRHNEIISEIKKKL